MNQNDINQSGLATDFVVKKDRLTSRYDRDVHQRRVARRNYAEVRKLLPKEVRARDVRRERYARRNVPVYDGEEADIRLEGFGGIAEAASVLGSVAIGSLLSIAAGKLVKMLGKTEETVGLVHKMVEDVAGIFSSLKKSACNLLDKLWVIPVAVLGYWLLDKYAGNSAIICVVLGALACIFGKKMWNFVGQYFPAGLRQESGIGEHPFKSLIMAIMCFSYLPREAGKLMVALMSRVSLLPRLSAGLDALFKVAVSICEAVINVILSVFGQKDGDGNPQQVYLGDPAYKAVKKWVMESYEKKSVLLEKPSPTDVMSVYDHVKAGYVLLQALKDNDLSNILKRSLDSLEIALQPFMGVVTAGKNFRAEPHFVLFTGPAGVGKSSLLVKFAVSVLLLAGEANPKDVLTQLFQKGSTEYWNGYVGQKCTIVDDVFQKVTALGEADSEYENIIRMINSWTFPLNMADLSSKGKFFFDSPLVMGTTNCSNIHETTYKQAVKSAEAVVRRIHDVVYIEAASDYALDGKMDYDKVESVFLERLTLLAAKDEYTADDVLACIPWEAWRAQRVDFHSFTFPAVGLPYTKPLDIKDLVLGVARSLRLKKARHQAAIGAMDTFAELLGDVGIVPQAGAEVPECETSAATEIRAAAEVPEYSTGQVLWYRLRCADFLLVPSEFPSELDVHKLNQLVRVLAKRRSTYVLEPDVVRERAKAFHSVQHSFSQELFFTLSVIYNKWLQEECSNLMDQNNHAALAVLSNQVTMRSLKRGPDVKEKDIYADLERSLRELFDFLVKPGAAQDVGLNTGGLTAFMSWLQSVRAELDEYYLTSKALADWVAKQATFQGLAVNFVKGMLKSVQKLNLVRFAGGAFAILAVVRLLRMSAKLILAIMRSVFNAVKAVFGFAEEEKVKVQVEEPVVVQGNHLAVLQDNQVYDKIYGNLHTLYLPDPNILVGQLLFIESGLAVMPKHLDSNLQKHIAEGKITHDSKLSILNGAAKYNKITITVKQFLDVPRYETPDEVTDRVFLCFPKEMNVTSKASIKNHFVSEADYKAIAMSALPSRFETTRLTRSSGEIRMQRHTMSAPVVRRVNGLPIGPVRPEFVWSSAFSTDLGDCGSPHFLARRSTCPSGKSIIGIHVGGNASFCQPQAVAIPVSRECVDKAVAHFNVVTDKLYEDLNDRGIEVAQVPIEVQGSLSLTGLVAGSFELIGEVSKPVSIAPKTRYTHTPLAKDEPFGPSGLKIAHLSPVAINGEVKYPMVEGLRNYQSPLIYRHIPDLDLIVSVATQRFQEESVYDTREIFSFQDAVLSPPLMKLKAINRATSAGYPFVLDGQPGKRAYFGYGDEYDLSGSKCAELEARVQHIIDQAKQGVRLSHLCIDFLKDETRPAAKVDACATRIISGTPLDYSIACRMYFGAFMAAMFRCNTLSGFSPGINPYQDWWLLAQKMRDGGSYYFDGDFSRFDASEQPYILWAILKFINNWYDDDPVNKRVREVLFMDLVHSRHLTSHQGPLRYIVQWNKCLPSGHPMTTPINSIYSMIALVLCYARTTGTCVDFWDKCYAGTNGDDNIVAVKGERIERFNQVTVAAAMEEHLDLKYTDGGKAGELAPHKPFEDLTYLKRSFREDVGNEMARGGWLAPLSLQSFLYSAYVTRARKNVAEDICNNLEFALGELSLHDIEVWDQYAHKIREQMARFGHAPKYGVSIDSYRQFMASKTDFWY